MRLILAALLTLPLYAQGIPMGPGFSHSGGGGGGATWTLVQHVLTSCFSASCTATITSTTSGNLLIAMSAAVNNVGTSSPSSYSVTGGGTWTHCASGYAAVSGGNGYAADCSYILSNAGSITSVSASWSTGFSATMDLEIFEVHRSTGTATYDTSNNATNAGCNSCTGPTLTLSGSSDFIAQFTVSGGAGNVTGIAAPYTMDNSPGSVTSGYAHALNASAGTAATWSTNYVGELMGMSAVAFK